MNRVFAVLAAAFLAAAMAQSASAYSDSSMKLSPSEVSICPCSTIDTVMAKLTNSKPFTDTYKLKLVLPGSGWSGFVQNPRGELSVEAYEQASAHPLWITAGCLVKPGRYDLKLSATSFTRSTDVSEGVLRVNVLDCHVVEVSIGQGQNSTCGGGVLQVPVTIKNSGKYNETFLLSSGVAWANLSPSEAAVNPGQSKSATLTMRPPADFYGSMNVSVSAASKSSQARAVALFQLSVEKCHAFEAVLQPAEKDGCVSVPATFTLAVINTGKSVETFSVKASQGMSASPASFQLEPNNKKEVKLESTPSAEGNRSYSVNVSSGTLPVRSLTAVIKAGSCKSVSVSVAPANSAACGGEEVKHTVTVKNTGAVASVFDVYASAGRLVKAKVTLAPGASESIELMVPAPASGKSNFTVKASSGGVSASASSEILAGNCYAAGISAAPVSACQCGQARLSATVKNSGSMDGNYTWELMGMANAAGAISVPAGGSDEIVHVFDVPCGAATCLQEITLLIKRGGVQLASGKIQVDVKPKDSCHAVKLEALGMEGISPDKPGVITVSITNLGAQAGTFRIYLEGPEWVYLSDNQTALGAGEKKEIYLYVSQPTGTASGSYPLILFASSGMADSKLSMELGVSNSTGITVSGLPVTGMATFSWPSWKSVAIGFMVLVIVGIIAARFFFMAPA